MRLPLAVLLIARLVSSSVFSATIVFGYIEEIKVLLKPFAAVLLKSPCLPGFFLKSFALMLFFLMKAARSSRGCYDGTLRN